MSSLFARGIGILCQGRGSAANSVVCYCLHITSVDPDRSHPCCSSASSAASATSRRTSTSTSNTSAAKKSSSTSTPSTAATARALTAVVTCYRPKSAIRDVGKGPGFSEAQLDLMSKDHSGWSTEVLPEEHRAALLQQLGMADDDPRLQQLIALARQLNGLPRHLSQHVGGFVC